MMSSVAEQTVDHRQALTERQRPGRIRYAEVPEPKTAACGKRSFRR